MSARVSATSLELPRRPLRLSGARLRPARALLVLALGLLLALAVWQMKLVGDFRVDDAYITFSFAKNLALGHGPIYSHGVRVEGYSNFLWMLLLAIGYRIAPAADPYVWARGLALVFLLGALHAVYKLVRRAGSAWAAFVALSFVLLDTDIMRAALSGLETVPFMASIVLGWAAYLGEPNLPRRRSLAWFLVAALLRIDGFVPLFVVLGYEFVRSLTERRFALRHFLSWLAPVVAIWFGYFVWRANYYGLPLPTTYYAKTLVDAADPQRGYSQFWAFCKDYGLLAILPLLVTPLFKGPRRLALGVALAAVLQVLYATQTGGDWMPFERFFLPALPLLAVLVGWGLQALWCDARALPGLLRQPLRALLLASVAFCGVRMHAASTDSPEELEKLGIAKGVAQHTRENLLGSVDLLRFVLRRPGERLATDYAGAFAVYTDAAIIDMWGLCNAPIARSGGFTGVNPIYGKSCPSCYRELDPEYFHVGVPLVRGLKAFANQDEVLAQIFQAGDIGRFLDLRRDFVVGRVIRVSRGQALWFLEKLRPGLSYASRQPAPDIRVDYPFLRAGQG